MAQLNSPLVHLAMRSTRDGWAIANSRSGLKTWQSSRRSFEDCRAPLSTADLA